MDHDADRRVDRRLRAVAVVCAAVSVVLCASAVALVVVARSRGLDVRAPNAGDVVVGSLFPLAGLLVLWRQPRNACGWVLLSCTSIAVSTLSQAWVVASTAGAEPLPGTGAAVWLAAWTFSPYWAQPVLLPLLFPHGRLPSARWRPFARVVAVLLVLLVLAAAFGPNDDVSGMGLPNPLGMFWLPVALGWGVVGVQVVSGLLLWLVAAPVALAGLVHRQRQATGVERAQLQWLLLGFVALLALTVASVPLDRPVSEVAFALGFAAVPLCLVVAVVRHRLLDVEVVVNRTIVYAGLSGASLLAYLAAVAFIGRLAGLEGSAPLVAGAVVACAAVARGRVQRWVDRRLFGARSDPYALVQQVSASTAAAAAPDRALEALVSTVCEQLRVPFAQVLDASGDDVAASGQPLVGTHVVPVVDGGEQVGVLVVGRRSRRERLRPDEHSALLEVARRAGALLSARRLSSDLERSYAELLQVREQERQRLQRDLHDGVGPALAGTALQLDSLATRLSDAPELAARAERLRDRLQDTVAEVRRIVEGLRPAALEAHGLPAALRALATSPADPVRVDVETDLPDALPADVEAAAYRIAGEAVANALRHAGAQRTTVRVQVAGDDVLLVVTDDGCGFGADVVAGVGLTSMRERAALLGGTLVVKTAPGTGTEVRAVLPVQRR